MSNKVTANKYSHAKKELQKIDSDYGVKVADQLPSEINQSDEGHYMVALVQINELPGTKKRVGVLHIQQYDRLSLEKVSKGVTQFGYDVAIVFHEPTVNQTVDSILNAGGAPDPVKTEAEIRAEVEAELDAKYAKKFQYVQEPHFADLSGMQEDDLKLFADVNKISLKGAKTAEEMKALIADWQLYTANPKEFAIAGLSEEELKLFASLNDIDVKKAKNVEELTTAITTWQADKK
jgi:hypothetical protein